MAISKVKVVISSHAHGFSATVVDASVDLVICGSGETIEDAKESLDASINKRRDEVGILPGRMKGEFILSYTFDVAGLLRYYSDILPPKSLELITGVNSKQISRYITGASKPVGETSEKIKRGLLTFIDKLKGGIKEL